MIWLASIIMSFGVLELADSTKHGNHSLLTFVGALAIFVALYIVSQERDE